MMRNISTAFINHNGDSNIFRLKFGVRLHNSHVKKRKKSSLYIDDNVVKTIPLTMIHEND